MPSSWLRSLRDAGDILRHARNPTELAKGLLPRRWLTRRILNEGRLPSEEQENRDVVESLRTLRNTLKAEAIDDRGRVDYAKLQDSETFAQMRATSRLLRTIDLDGLEGDAARTAFWVNVYNVLSIHGVIALGIVDSVMEVPSFFGTVAYEVGGLVLTLDEIENGVLRRNAPHPATGARPFSQGDRRARLSPSSVDARIHAALVCSSTSCPPVAFYDAGDLDRQLDLATASYVAGDVEVDEDRQTVWLPMTFRYYQDDFGGRDGVWQFVLCHAAGAQRDALGNARRAGFSFDYHRYDWSLNAIA